LAVRVRSTNDEVTLSTPLRDTNSVTQASPLFRVVYRAYRYAFVAFVVVWVLDQTNLFKAALFVWGSLNLMFIIGWMATRPVLVVTVARAGGECSVKGHVRVRRRRLALNRVTRALVWMATVTAAVARETATDESVAPTVAAPQTSAP
jgi:hypothetical protein